MKLALSRNRAVAITACLICTLFTKEVWGESELSLSQETLAVSYEAARLSDLTYHDENELLENGEREEIKSGSSAFITHFTHPDFEEFEYIKIYTQEPDQALVAKKEERCFIAFRGTVGISAPDWLQNLDVRARVVHRDNNTELEGCEVRKGFVDFLDSIAVDQVFADVVKCMDSISCKETDGSCLVIAGHSQGGASATVASILLNSLDPTVVTFGQPPAVDKGCNSIPSERFYRYINVIKEPGENDDMAFDPVVFVPTLLSESVHYGHGILLGEDPNSVKYLGLDDEADFTPSIFDRGHAVEVHAMGTDSSFSYQSRVGALLDNSPIRTDGFSDGAFCDRDYHQLCASGWCSFDNECSPKISETCVPSSCEKDVDCESGACVRDSCTVAKGMVGGGCPCYMNKDCASGNCDKAIATLFGWTCEYGPGEEVKKEEVETLESVGNETTDGSGATAISFHFVLYAAGFISMFLYLA